MRQKSRTQMIFETRLYQSTGLTFPGWVDAKLQAGLSLRRMATEVGLPHGTIWRWIRRQLPDAKLRSAPPRDPPTDAEFRLIVRVWRDEDVKSTNEIVRLTRLPKHKIKHAKKLFHRQSQDLMAKLSRTRW